MLMLTRIPFALASPSGQVTVPARRA
jgi:hypothetical protein